jgi:hypothetical protein
MVMPYMPIDGEVDISKSSEQLHTKMSVKSYYFKYSALLDTEKAFMAYTNLIIKMDQSNL